MSVRFKNFLNRVAKDCEFKPLNNKLLNFLIKESENKYKNHPRLINKMKRYWPKYRDRSRISHLLKDHYEDIFYFYLTVLFPFRKAGLKLEDPEAPTPVDFKLVYRYRYNSQEIKMIDEILKKYNIKASIEGILKRILIFTVSSFAPMVEVIFQRPFAFQFSNIDTLSHENGDIEVIAIISAREQ
ncbi:MAG: hypothetical protein ACTSQJ_11155 [Promethearchaeota archaeon]